MRIFIGFIVVAGAIMMSACTPTTNTLPTVAQLPTTAPTTASSPTSFDPTPTREGDTSSPAPTTDPGTLGTGSVGIEADLPALVGNGFVGAYTGAISGSINANGAIACTNDALMISSETAGSNRIIFNLPANARAGVYTLGSGVTVDAQTGSAEYIADNGTRFATGVDGILVLDALNLSDVGSIEGTFEFSAVANGGTITLSGAFNIPASNATNCAG